MATINEKMTAIGDAIRTKTGKTELLTLDAMATEISNISTGVELNFEVVGGTSAPANPKENTIWVNTSTTISGWTFSATEPYNPEDGVVWIITSSLSSCELNILKDNCVNIYPNSAKQYIKGKWVDVEVQTYQNGAWTNWRVYLYNAGNECTTLTGGWEFAVKRYAAGITAQDSACTYEKNEDHLYIHKYGVGMGNIMYAKNPIDISSYSSLVFEGNMDDGGGGGYADRVRLCVWSNLDGHSTDNIVAQITGNRDGGIVNVSSLTGKFFIGFLVYGDASVTLRSMYLE